MQFLSVLPTPLSRLVLRTQARRYEKHEKAGQCYISSSRPRTLLHCVGKHTMSGETFSIMMRCSHDIQTDTIRVRLVRVDTGEEVHLNEGTFLLRISTDEDTLVERCLIRHIASGREAYVQGGPNLRAFVRDCLLQSYKC